MRRHLHAGNPSTKGASDWVLKWVEEHATRSEAMARESYIKSRKSRGYIEGLIDRKG